MGETWQPGQLIASRYRLEAPLGAGAGGEVWRAFDQTLEAPVALKLLNPELVGSPTAKRFLREARAAARIRSLHVVQILDVGQELDGSYIAMELLEGETLADRLDRVRLFAAPKACKVVQDVAKAAGKAHDAGIVHRDLKPANVFLVAGEEGDEEIAKVFDFGIAKVRVDGDGGKTGTTKAGTLLGTPHYMSPEQALGRAVDFRSDLYAIGVLAFEMLTGRLPYDTDNVAEVLYLAAHGKLHRPTAVAPVPRAFDLWFAKATALDPAQRFPSAKDLAGALRTCLLR